MKRMIVIGLISALFCSSCNELSSSTVTKNSFYDAIENKYSEGCIRIPNGIYKIQSKINYHYGSGEANGFVNNIIFAEINNMNVTKLNQQFEGLVFNFLFNSVVSYIGNYNYDGKTKYEETIRTVKHIDDGLINEEIFRIKEDLDKFIFFGSTSSDLCGYYFFREGSFKSSLNDSIRINSFWKDEFFEEDKKIVRRESAELNGIMTKTVYLDNNLEYEKEEIVFNYIYADAIFTYEKLDSYDFKNVENIEQYKEGSCERCLQIV